MRVRPPTEADAAAVAELVAACDVAEIGEPDSDEVDVRETWALPGVDLASDAWLVESGGRLVGYGFTWAREGGRVHAETRVRPAADVDAVAARLIRLVDERARAQAAERIHNTVVASSPVAASLARAGYRVTRHHLRMRIDLADLPPAPELPADVTLRTFRADEDDRAVYELMSAAFSEDPDFVPAPFEAWRARLVDTETFDPNLWFLLEADGELVGAAICFPFLDGGWVQGIAVRRDRRRRGLGHALLVTAFGAFWERGRRRVGLEVDADNPTEARRVYERAGMREAFRFDRYEKTLGTL